MGCYRADATPRVCEICRQAVQLFEWTLDLDRAKGGWVKWAHADCCELLTLWWLRQRWEKELRAEKVEQASHYLVSFEEVLPPPDPQMNLFG
jgi:hypothetical protein